MKRVLTVGEELSHAVEKVLVGPVERLGAASGREALDAHRARPAAVIVFGLEVPDMPAESFVRRIREDQGMRDVSLLLVCDETRNDELRAARCRANAVVKPASDQAALRATLRRLLSIPLRAEFRTLMRVTSPGNSHPPPFFFARSRNISTAGILLEARSGLGTGDRVACSFPLPSGSNLSAAGEIVRVVDAEEAPWLYGIAWRDLSPEAWACIDGFVERIRSRGN